MENDQGQVNTDKELWREREGDFYSDRIFITEGNGLGIDVGGMVIVKPVQEWFNLARKDIVHSVKSVENTTPECNKIPSSLTTCGDSHCMICFLKDVIAARDIELSKLTEQYKNDINFLLSGLDEHWAQLFAKELAKLTSR